MPIQQQAWGSVDCGVYTIMFADRLVSLLPSLLL